MEQPDFERMQKMQHKLEDIKSSQESIIDKINHVITDLFQQPNKELEKSMEDLHQKASDNIDIIQEALDTFDIKFNKAQQS